MKFVLFAFLLVAIASCSDEQEQSRRKMRTILSWSATAGMIIDASQKSLVPKGFTKLSLARCRSEIDSLSQQLAQTSQQDLSAQAAGLNKMIEAAEEDIDSGRRDDASKHIADLQRMEENLKARSGAAQ